MRYPSQSPVRFAVLGMDRGESYSYEYCISHYPGKAYALADSVEDAELLLIDVDSPEGRHIAYQHLTGEVQGKVPVILSASQSHPEGVFFLHKPASPEALRTVLDQAAAQIGRNAFPNGQVDKRVIKAALAMEEEVPPSNHYTHGFDDASRNMFFDPSQCLYGAVQQTYRRSETEGRVVELRSGMLPLVRICARTKRVYPLVRELVLRSVVALPASSSVMSVLDEEDGSNWPNDGQTEGMEGFLWRMAAWTSRGRLPEGADPNARMCLRYWPNMTRLIPIPHGMQIAALWSSGVCTIATIAEDLMIPLGDVHVFYCAASAIGLMEIEARTSRKTTQTAQADQTAPKTQSQRSLLGRILSRLMGTR
ncbi:MAG: hypothetical protein FWC38_01690 [Proteobacteria bacterium]|nr:hypothetical protein [Pseudomonadota bacterium]MCL2306953.1 hypothetical protein [Pseudomonadota bacterium]